MNMFKNLMNKPNLTPCLYEYRMHLDPLRCLEEMQLQNLSWALVMMDKERLGHRMPCLLLQEQLRPLQLLNRWMSSRYVAIRVFVTAICNCLCHGLDHLTHFTHHDMIP